MRSRLAPRDRDLRPRHRFALGELPQTRAGNAPSALPAGF